MFKKLFFFTALVAMLAAAILPGTPALAMTTRNIRFALVDKVTVVSDQPAAFRLRGTYTCDKVQLTSTVSGKVITIYAYDVKIVGGGNTCSKAQSFNRVINLGSLVPGKYTVWINPTNPGLAAKKFVFIAPILSTPTPAPTKP